MKNITNKIIKNPYIRIENNSVVFLTLLENAINKLNKNLKISEKSYFHILIKYPNIWPEDLDLFSFIDKKVVREFRRRNSYFIFDASAEGFSPFEKNWFKIFYNSCEKHSIDPRQIILVSSNLKDEDNIKKYCKDSNLQPINVISLPLFENACQSNNLNIEERLNLHINNSKNYFKDKYFSSLSRLNRHYRIIGTFLLCQSSVSTQGLISHNKLNKNNFNYNEIIRNTGYTEKEIKNWINTLPLIVDYSDFETNWAVNTKFDHIHDQTIFQIVNETIVDSMSDTSLFYSEKTFRPISRFQPFIIYGQPGCNVYLKNLGYKLYDDWFDLSFDTEPDNIKRYQKLLVTVEDTCKMLDSLTRDQKIEWRFKNLEILIHNVKTMNTQEYTFEKLEKFLLELENQINNH